MSIGRLLLASCVAAAIPFAAAAQEAGVPPITSGTDEPLAIPEGATLVWADEFDTPGLPDPKRWAYDVAMNRGGWPNKELQYYSAARPENARVEDGHLIIEARKEALTDRDDHDGQQYSSARLYTRGVADWTYGFVEVRAKLPCGTGTWPAIWMLGSDDNTPWPNVGEIDIMEHVGWDPGRIHANVHTGSYNHVIGTQKGSNTLVPDACDSFHKYQLDWNAERILIGIDGHAYMRFENDGTGNRDTWPYDAPEFLILNIAVGGTWGGMRGVDDSVFPVKMEVDYVRVYQKR